MTISEPVTLLTDYALAVASLYFGHRTFHHPKACASISMKLWAAAFVATAAASLFGGTFHGFVHHLGPGVQAGLWKATVYSVGLMSLLMLAGATVASIPRAAQRWVLCLAVLQFVVYAVWMVTHDDFRFVIYDYAPAMIGVLGLQSWAAYRRRDASAKWIIAGVLVSFAAAGVQQTGFRRGQDFNHNDLYHVIQMAALYLFYRGGWFFKDQR